MNSLRVRTVSSTSSSDGVETEQIAADLVLPATGTQSVYSKGSKRTEVYYFYQAADGQHVYLHSINTRLGSIWSAMHHLAITMAMVVGFFYFFFFSFTVN